MTAVQMTYEDDEEIACSEALPEGTVLLNGQYTIEKYLSSGGFGITYFARDSLDRRVVIKECFPEAFCNRKNKTVLARSRTHQNEFRSFVDMFVREAHSIAKLKHPNIVGVHQVFEDNETAYMALDLIDGKDLLDTIELGEKQLAPAEIKNLLLKVLDAVSTVHAQDMLHRDISPDNILIDAWDNPMLIDFGAAREEASKKSRALSAVLVVKDGYSPQEFYIAGSQQTPCSDLYALAATFCHLISGEAPPNSQTRLSAIASKKPDPYVPLAGRIQGYEPGFLDAIDTAMNVFPQDRIQTARDWILEIDDKTRHQVALSLAHKDKEIENTVMQFIIDAQHDAQPIVAPHVDITETPKPEVRPPEAIVMTQLVEHDPGPDPDPAPLVRQNISRNVEKDWITRCYQREVKPVVKDRRRTRKVARLVISAALFFFVLDGHAARLAEAVAPLVQEVMSLRAGAGGGFG